MSGRIWEPTSWTPPADIDDDCIELCSAINISLPGVLTVESCCGHGKQPFQIWCLVKSLRAVAALAYWLDSCHSGAIGWRLIAITDCGERAGIFMIEGPVGSYAEGAARIADAIDQAAKPRQTSGWR